MRALRAEDPETLGGHRLLARLGAGGMGTVYLARAADGAVVAVKMIRAEYAADPAFRARFRREVRLATGLDARWVVPVTAADTEAREPWLATAFVPGPSLAETVDGHGPLPAHTVVVLGARLAQALAEVHAAGLVHRDVKPGNILLAHDGPRLIDFGIAQGSGATALTAPDAIIGTPGYLSPEQARPHEGEVGPPGDVFSLGCVLAYAATGQRPFGTGDAAAVLYRTVHEDPDLTGLDRLLPPPVHEAITGCLAKDPRHRPTAAELRDAFEAVTGRAPRGAEGRGTSRGAGPRGEGDWLPPEVLRLVADRSSRALNPPPRPPAAPDPSPPEPVQRLPRRRILAIGGLAVAASGTGAAVLLSRRNTAATAGTPRTVPTHTIGFQADLTGLQKDTGTAQERGAALAVATHNARADASFRLALARYDDRGETARAKDAARSLLVRSALRAVVGPTTAAAARAAGPLYAAASTPFVLVSVDADEAGLSRDSLRRTLCETRTSGSERALPVILYLTRVHSTRRTAVIEDQASGQTAWDISQYIREAPPSEGTVTIHPVAADTDDFRPAVLKALATHPQAVIHAGVSPSRAAACARALAAAGFTGPRMGFEPVMRPAFLTAAGDAAEGWICEAPYTEPESAGTKASEAFTAAYRKRYGQAPGRWAAEAYDAVGLIARALDALGGGAGVEPGQVAERLFRTAYDGVAKPIRFTQDATHTLNAERASFLCQARDGDFRFLGRYDQAR
ncbi:bifunctional serine/threonine-protein kinase/ABC transporter substrate-binding protein [Streptomyces sp. GbtcB6]|uniref:bifunctional serine/threonine-protein kinase/ABC transporter substrate-binding protein n=1 Tax=Streptomyces sp. GbtcB6 TaxID=2824751 RepID=UPI001C304E44|nr:bifunctional serine/threonine-protein kinase/ABC transporter substrate-binding protein [Streptomyces sp. GbtcB6]